jgi:diadenosine tetraphosphatase ApaH/serine/threonine PP2A family protein phosphatase
MKYAICGDIHANLQALEAVLADAREQGVTHYACVGDIVGYNADPRACLDIVRDLKGIVVKGNHDHYCSHDENLNGFQPLAADAVDWTRRQLTPEDSAWLKALKLVQRVETFTIVHGTLDMPEAWGYVFDKLEAESSFAYQFTNICFCGHTHVPMAFEKTDTVRGGGFSRLRVQMGRKYLINCGSVGQPRDGDPRASYAIYNLRENAIELRRVAYDVAEAQRRIRAAGLPPRMAERLALGR